MQSLTLIPVLKAICARPLFSCKIISRGVVVGFFSGNSMAVSKTKGLIRAAFCALALCFSMAGAAQAGIAPSPCDPNYYDSLKSRAWLEAQREITQNQNLITKPDSVLQYTCFDQFMGLLAFNTSVGNLFSGTLRWGVIRPPTSMTTALNALVGTALISYTASNFPHTFRGGRSPQVRAPIPVVPQPVYACAWMNTIWLESKCVNFVENSATDGFYTFENYRNSPDKRILPVPCVGAPASWTTEINRSTVNAFTPWQEDNASTYLNLLTQCNGTSLEIATGITVRRSKAQPSTYLEKICVAPGCRYVPTGMNTGNCAPP